MGDRKVFFMPKIPATGIAKRFCGQGRARAIVESLLSQPLVGGQRALAEEFRKTGTILSFKKGKRITAQGAADNEMYFLLCGSVNVIINGHIVATRSAGTHFGEMAAMDYTAKRSASVVAVDEVVVLQIAQARFVQIANQYLSVWHHVALDIAARLRERSKFLRTPNSLPILFIGSSSEGQSVACEIKRACENKCKVEVHLWSDGVFQASKTVIEDLVGETNRCDFSVLVLTPDDNTKSRGQVKPAPRDNVIYELGLFTGALGRDRSLIVMPSDVNLKIPTDLLGVTTLRYKPAKTQNTLNRRLDSVAAQIVKRIEEHGPK